MYRVYPCILSSIEESRGTSSPLFFTLGMVDDRITLLSYMNSQDMSAKFDFVTVGDFGKPKPEHRRLIRSRCMQGKNKRGGSRRSLQQERKAAKKQVEELQTHALSRTLRACPSDLALVQLPGELGLDSDEILFKYLTYGAIRNLVNPIEVCVNVDPLKPHFFAWPFYETTFFHAALLTTSATNDYLLKRPLSKTTYFHLQRTLYFLNRKLSNERAYLEDPLVYVIVILTLMAATFGDTAAATTHMDGLLQIIHLRGGMEYLREHPGLHYKLDRLDLSWCLGFGGMPRFADQNMSWDPMFSRQAISSNQVIDVQNVDSYFVDSRLREVFQDAQQLVRLINEHFSKNTKFHGETFQNTISSVQTRLLILKDMLSSSLDECICLATLAFMTTTFQIPDRKVPYRDLRKRLRKLHRPIPRATAGLQDLQLWVLFLSAISVLDDDEVWLVERWGIVANGGMEWDNVRRRLQSVLWIDCIHDKLGREAYFKMTSRVQISVVGEAVR
ncbi:hypothetical protein K504DRAFT_492809 [Pleomassaria siparia CBS 279.74]|uniref:Transcription factor domain-containing protein n=1 Tax=Pleomassaria siparia CBS 279.74 TaxID=1314801 RepID=A0A6G1K3X0_9PLEO|nr:hypothetical protein K504DRAFT_492809 [Pleomassaria siparia CBS 279.74]